MKRNPLLPLAGAIALLIGGTSCSDYYGHAPSTKRGAVAGGLVGAGVGTIVGSQSDRPLEGAAIGGAIGALGGAVLGSARDDHYYRSNNANHNRSGYNNSSYHRPTYRSSGYYESSSHYYSPRPYYGSRSYGYGYGNSYGNSHHRGGRGHGCRY